MEEPYHSGWQRMAWQRLFRVYSSSTWPRRTTRDLPLHGKHIRPTLWVASSLLSMAQLFNLVRNIWNSFWEAQNSYWHCLFARTNRRIYSCKNDSTINGFDWYSSCILPPLLLPPPLSTIPVLPPFYLMCVWGPELGAPFTIITTHRYYHDYEI